VTVKQFEDLVVSLEATQASSADVGIDVLRWALDELKKKAPKVTSKPVVTAPPAEVKKVKHGKK